MDSDLSALARATQTLNCAPRRQPRSGLRTMAGERATGTDRVKCPSSAAGGTSFGSQDVMSGSNTNCRKIRWIFAHHGLISPAKQRDAPDSPR